ncbi:MAG TPA: dihydrofolate reductase family protein, partial [Asanoa sp.]|nr:dihydrofolate reductase family protein [Asanoa sp.]
MRRIVAQLFMSLDGVVEAPNEWHFPYFNDEMGAAVGGTLSGADTYLIGRKTYEAFAGAWPDRELAGGEDAPMAKQLGDTRKVVVSNQELEFTWRNSEPEMPMVPPGSFFRAVTAATRSPRSSS